MPNPTLLSLADDLEAGRTSARKLVEECIARIAAPDGEGQRAFIHVDKDAALAAADAMDHLRKANAAPSRFAGIPVSIKDLFDIRGQVTRAGSRALGDSAAAGADAPGGGRVRRIAGRMPYAALGSDTGGSCRIPAAYNGIVGYKPTQRRIPLDGGVPLSFSLDSFGPLANSVQCCATLDAVLADEQSAVIQRRPIKGMRLAVPTTVSLDDLD